MSLVNRREAHKMARCQQCDHDLITRPDAKVYCTNLSCRHRSKPHPTGKEPNAGFAKR